MMKVIDRVSYLLIDTPWACTLFLMKIVICNVPTKAGHYADYKLITLFETGLTYLEGGSQEWKFLYHPHTLRTHVHYGDAIEHGGITYVVDQWDGSMHCRDPA
jgi:hypothetical protein